MTTARELFDQADLILLDFDGPVTRLLPPPCNAELASRAKDACLAAGVPLSPEGQRSTDHLSFIRAAGKYSEQALAAVESLCTQGEVAAAATSPVTLGILDLLEASSRAGKAVVIVTNNSPECVEKFLELYSLAEAISCIIGRQPGRPDLMKPHPSALIRALEKSHHRAVMIGDSVSDIEAANMVEIPVIGLAKDAQRAHQLTTAGASVVVASMHELTV